MIENKVIIERMKKFKVELSGQEQQWKNFRNALSQLTNDIVGTKAIIAEYERILKEDEKVKAPPDIKKKGKEKLKKDEPSEIPAKGQNGNKKNAPR